MTDTTQDCTHGQLARSCDRCADAAEIASQAAEIARLTAELAEAQAKLLPTSDDLEYAELQNWNIDGTTAYHLIDRHADGWAGVGLMMKKWRDAAANANDVHSCHPQCTRPLCVAQRDLAAAQAEAQALRVDAAKLRDELSKTQARGLDAARYDWLRLNSYVEVRCNSPRLPGWNPESLDDEIDAARAQEATKPGSAAADATTPNAA